MVLVWHSQGPGRSCKGISDGKVLGPGNVIQGDVFSPSHLIKASSWASK